MVLPDGRCDVILQFDAGRDDAPLPILTGPATEPFEVSYQAGDVWLGIRMRPEAGGAVWGDALGDMTNAVLQGQDALNFMPALAQASVGQSMDELCATLLGLPIISQAEPCPTPLKRALDVAHLTAGRMSAPDLAQLAGVTARHLGRLFQQHVGVATKTYLRLLRFHRSVVLLKAGHLSLSQTAHEAGFSDQAHITRDIRAFGGFAPSALPRELSQPEILA